jgi:hypothetical protein
MRWRCALLQRWLPDYPDGNLPAFWKRRLGAHLEKCPACRVELAELGEIVGSVKATPLADPGPDFWQEFSREMHLKLVQAAQAAPPPRRFRMPYYLLGAPAVAVLLLWVGAQIMEHQSPVSSPASRVAQQPASETTPGPSPAPRVAQKPGGETKSQEQVSPASLPALSAAQKMKLEQLRSLAKEIDEDGELIDEDFSSWDPEPVLSELTDQEREILLKRLRTKEKDGSCVTFPSSAASG